MPFAGLIQSSRINDLELVRHVVWRLRGGASGNGVAVDAFARSRSVTAQVEGTFVGGTVAFEVSNDGAHFTTPPTGVSLNSAGLAAFPAGDLAFRWLRPVLSGGGVSTDLTVTVVGAN